MNDKVIQELVDLGVAINVDGYEESIKQLKGYENKYNIPSICFYEDYYQGNRYASIIGEDRADWIFYCNCFLSCGGDLNSFQHQQNDELQSLIECEMIKKKLYFDNKDDLNVNNIIEGCKNPSFFL